MPKVQENISGKNWDIEGSIIHQNDIVLVSPKMELSEINDSIKKVNEGTLSNPKALVFTPGVYDFDNTIEITSENTVILGLGVPVLSVTKPHISIMQTKAKGVKIGGIIFEAGSNDNFLNSLTT